MTSIGCWRPLAKAALALAVLLATAIDPLGAQTDPAANFPNKPIRLIVGFAAGGGNDIFARLVGQKLSEFLGQSLVIANFPLIMVGPTSNPSKTVPELVAWAKAHPDKANYATSSPAFTIATELLKLKTGMPGVAIPWKSSNEMILCVAAENCLLAIADGPPTVPLVKGGQVRALAVTGSERSAELPEVPSMAEIGLPEVNTKLWSGVFAPAATPPAIAKKLEAELRRAIASPDVSARLRSMAVNPGAIPSDEFRRIVDADIKAYAEIVKAAKLIFEE